MPMPLSSRVASPEGGKLAGMRMIVVSMPCCSSRLPERLPAPQQLDRRRSAGTANCQCLIDRPPASVLVVDRYGIIVFGSRWTKSKMPWPPGSSPVMKLDQATGLCGGMDVPSGAKWPVVASREKFGMRPRAMRSRVSCSRAHRTPSTMTRLPRRGWRLPQASVAATDARAAGRAQPVTRSSASCETVPRG